VESASRLHRYHRKDYSRTVSFPVEIISRDGSVRHYGFDESVRLYQRRLHSAPVRYADPRVIDAEVLHCRSRIAQLRRSFLEQHPLLPVASGVLSSPLAADLADLVSRSFPGAPRIRVIDAPSVASAPTVLHVVTVGAPGSMGRQDTGALESVGPWHMLYVWVLADAAGAEAFERSRAALAAAPDAPEVERLQVVYRTEDLGVLATGVDPWEGPVPRPAWVDAEPERPYEAALRACHAGHPDDALRLLEAELDHPSDDLPPTLVARAAATMALEASDPLRALFALRIGAYAAPDDGALAALEAIALARDGRLGQAADRVAHALPRARAEALPQLSLVAACLAVVSWRPFDAVRAVQCRGRTRDGASRRAWSGAWRRVLIASGLSASMCGLAAVLEWWGAPVGASVGASLGGIVAAGWGLRRAALRALRGSPGSVRLCGPEFLPRVLSSGQ
jgi:hypothetical protein